MLFSFCALAPVAMRESLKVHKHTLERQWKGVVYIGTFLALNIALNNVSLLDISLSLNQIIRYGLACLLVGWCTANFVWALIICYLSCVPLLLQPGRQWPAAARDAR